MSESSPSFDLTIIGGGPVGLFAAYYAGLRRMRTKIIDSLDQLGGQLTALYPEKYIYDVPGFPKVLAKDPARSLSEQALQYQPTLCLSQTVQTLTPLTQDSGPLYRIRTDVAEHLTRTLVISAGAGAFAPKKLPVPEADLYLNRGVYYSVASKQAFAGRRVLIVGGGDSAIDWALNLADVAAHITLIHRRNQFRAHEDSVRQVLASGIDVLTFHELKSLHAANGTLSAACIYHNQTQAERMLPADAVLIQVGFTTSLGAIRHWPLEFSTGPGAGGGGGIRVDRRMQTQLPGIFAAGDVAAYEGKLKLIATGFGEAATAVNYAKTLLDPKAKAFPGHTSEMTPQAITTL